MESVTSSLLEILFQAQQAWDEEKNVFKLHLEGAGNAAMQNWNMCAILVAQNGLQAGQLQQLDRELRNVLGERDTANQNLLTTVKRERCDK
jgi:hypothetical protein